jgi:hypothetical protein
MQVFESLFLPINIKYFDLFIIPNSNVVPGRINRIPRDVEPAVAGQELVGVFTSAEEVD